MKIHLKATFFSTLAAMILVCTALADTMNAGFRLNEGFPSPQPIDTVFVGPEPTRTASPALEHFSDPQYQPTSLTNDVAGRMEIIGSPAPVVPTIQGMPMSGTNYLGNILGPGESRYVFNSLNGICGDDRNVAYERRNGQTALTFETGLEIVVDDITGSILTPLGLPCVSDATLADLTWSRMEESGDIARWRARFQKTDENGAVLRRLAEIRLDEIYRVADKAFVAWRLVDSPTPEDGFFVRLVHWVDIPSGEIVFASEEYNSRPQILALPQR